MSDHSLLYKNNSKLCSSQAHRRKNLLDEQKKKRHLNIDVNRQLFHSQKCTGNPNFREHYKNMFQRSEWMLTLPEDIEDWYLIPCPKGKRCLIICENGRSEAIDKNGKTIKRFYLNVPGGTEQNHKGLTIIDAIYDYKCLCFWALDLLAYGNQNFVDCDCSFRSFFIKSKIEENNLESLQYCNTVIIKPLPFVLFSNSDSIKMCLSSDTIFEQIPDLDGFLFYHKDSSYTFGDTLALWLYPFMLKEIFGEVLTISSHYNLTKPSNFVDNLSFIKQFTNEQKMKCNKRVLVLYLSIFCRRRKYTEAVSMRKKWFFVRN